MRVIGIDPDSKKYGVAIYNDGKLDSLLSIDVVEIAKLIKSTEALYVIENVLANKFMYARNDKAKKQVSTHVAQAVGMCKQSQYIVMKFLDYYDRDYLLEKPTKSNWAKHKHIFEKATGWSKRSNEDTRSAAFFGYLHKDIKTYMGEK